MNKLAINVDAGERGFGDELDLAFLNFFNRADELNIALGGHAGDPMWSQDLANRASNEGVLVNLHPGYPDREGFGRLVLEMSERDLRDALSKQRAVLPMVMSCKFHGALYNQAMVNVGMAEFLVDWAKTENITQLLVMPGSELERVAVKSGLMVRREAFLDRAYVKQSNHVNADCASIIILADRSEDGAVFDDVSRCLEQYERLLHDGEVKLLTGEIEGVNVQTACIHGDGKVGLSVVREIRGAW